jgi:hypothetical protein
VVVGSTYGPGQCEFLKVWQRFGAELQLGNSNWVSSINTLPKLSLVVRSTAIRNHHQYALWLATGNANDLFPLCMSYKFLPFRVLGWCNTRCSSAVVSSREDVEHMVGDSISKYDF